MKCYIKMFNLQYIIIILKRQNWNYNNNFTYLSFVILQSYMF